MAANDRRLMRAWVLGALAACTLCRPAAADVYVSQAPDGSLRYSSQPLDASYKLLFSEAPTSGRSAGAKKASKAREDQLDPHIASAAEKYQLPASIIRAVVAVESGFDPGAVSPKGARGAMQLMPQTARRYGITNLRELHQPERNIDAGARHFKDLLAKHDGNLALALAAYNAGPAAVAKYSGRIPPYRETMLYVPAVLSRAVSESTP